MRSPDRLLHHAGPGSGRPWHFHHTPVRSLDAFQHQRHVKEPCKLAGFVFETAQVLCLRLPTQSPRGDFWFPRPHNRWPRRFTVLVHLLLSLSHPGRVRVTGERPRILAGVGTHHRLTDRANPDFLTARERRRSPAPHPPPTKHLGRDPPSAGRKVGGIMGHRGGCGEKFFLIFLFNKFRYLHHGQTRMLLNRIAETKRIPSS